MKKRENILFKTLIHLFFFYFSIFLFRLMLFNVCLCLCLFVSVSVLCVFDVSFGTFFFRYLSTLVFVEFFICHHHHRNHHHYSDNNALSSQIRKKKREKILKQTNETRSNTRKNKKKISIHYYIGNEWMKKNRPNTNNKHYSLVNSFPVMVCPEYFFSVCCSPKWCTVFFYCCFSLLNERIER